MTKDLIITTIRPDGDGGWSFYNAAEERVAAFSDGDILAHAFADYHNEMIQAVPFRRFEMHPRKPR